MKHEVSVLGRMKIKGTNKTLQVKHIIDENGKYKCFTDGLIFGKNLEIVFSKKHQCFKIKRYKKLKSNHLKKHGQPVRDIKDILKQGVEKL